MFHRICQEIIGCITFLIEQMQPICPQKNSTLEKPQDNFAEQKSKPIGPLEQPQILPKAKLSLIVAPPQSQLFANQKSTRVVSLEQPQLILVSSKQRPNQYFYKFKQFLWIAACLAQIGILAAGHSSFYQEWSQLNDKSQLVFRTVSCLLCILSCLAMIDFAKWAWKYPYYIHIQEFRFVPLGITSIVVNFTQLYYLALHDKLLPESPTLIDWCFHFNFVIVNFGCNCNT